MTRTGIEQGGGAQHRNQSPSGALVSPRVPTSRNVYRGCCTRKGVFNLTRTGIEQGGGAQHRNQSPGGALVSPGVPTARNVYRGCCRFPLRPLPVKMRLERPAGRDKRK